MRPSFLRLFLFGCRNHHWELADLSQQRVYGFKYVCPECWRRTNTP